MSQMISLLKKYKVKTIIIIVIIAITSGASYVSTNSSSYSRRTIPKIDPERQYEVIKVIDGDTFDIKVNGKIVKVRMLGIDTPESIDPRKTVQCFGKEASNKTKELLFKHYVKLQTDSTQGVADKYGRLLAYVYRDDGIFINKYLLENGYAHEYTYNIPYEKQGEFRDLEKRAKEDKNGLWGEICNNI